VLLLGLYTLEPAVFPSIWPSEFLVGGMNEPSVYVHCCGWKLGGYVFLNVFGRGYYVVAYDLDSVGFWGIFPCVREFDVVVCGCRFNGVDVYVCVRCVLEYFL
jgi:hypothetical protein